MNQPEGGLRGRRYWYAASAVLALLLVLWGFRLFLDTRAAGEPGVSESLTLYALSSVNILLLGVLLFILFRNLVKVLLERRRGILGARFQARLVLTFLFIAAIPSIGLFWITREVMGKSIESLFNPPLEKIMNDSFAVAEGHYRFVLDEARGEAARLARQISSRPEERERLEDFLGAQAFGEDAGRVTVYGLSGLPLASEGNVWEPVEERLSLAAEERRKIENGEVLARWTNTKRGLVQALAPVKGKDGSLACVVSVEKKVTPELRKKAAGLAEHYESYAKFNARKRSVKQSRVIAYGSIYLLVIFAACWLGLVMARAITRPVAALLEGTKALSEGRLDHRVEVEAAQEFGTLVQSFNRMTGDLAASRAALEEAGRAMDERRRYIEVILETVPAGVVSLNPELRVESVNGAARHLLGVEPSANPGGEEGKAFFERHGAAEAWRAFEEFRRSPAAGFRREILLAGPSGGSRQILLDAVAARGESEKTSAWVLVLEDLTELSRAQKIAAWQDVAQRLAREIKNPLTPVQLAARNILDRFNPSDPAYAELLRGSAREIIEEIQSLKVLVDEFGRFARMPAPAFAPMQAGECVDAAVALYEGHYEDLRIHKRVEDPLPLIKGDSEQIKRVLVNLLENAIEASGRKGDVWMEASFDRARGVLRLAVRDQGRGIPPGQRENLFLPYFSTRVRGMGLGLAIVNRIVTDHGGRIRAEDNVPQGSVFIVELPG